MGQKANELIHKQENIGNELKRKQKDLLKVSIEC